jgi:ApaG protein
MVTQITDGIRVSVETQFQQEHSDPARMMYVFTYRITIENKSPYSIQLLRRHWFIRDIHQEPREVEGEGVVGQQPVIEPGSRYQYISGCNLHSGFGKMFGYFTMERLIDGKKFTVQIPEFVMVAPAYLN